MPYCEVSVAMINAAEWVEFKIFGKQHSVALKQTDKGQDGRGTVPFSYSLKIL